MLPRWVNCVEWFRHICGREVEGEKEARRPAQGTGTGSLVGPYFMLLSQKLGKLPIATHSLLRQARARPLHQHKIVLVDRSRWHLWRMRLVGTGLQAHQNSSSGALSSSLPITLSPVLGLPSIHTDITKPSFGHPSPSVLPCTWVGPALWRGTGDAAANRQPSTAAHNGDVST